MNKENTSRLEIKFFGVLKSAAPGGAMTLDLAPGARVGDLRLALLDPLGSSLSGQAKAALEAAAIGTADRLLADDEPVGGLGTVAILPPVSGG